MIKNSNARKEYICSKCNTTIKKGDKYFRGDRFMAPPIIRCQNCGIHSWECSSSEYTQTVGSVCDGWEILVKVKDITDKGVQFSDEYLFFTNSRLSRMKCLKRKHMMKVKQYNI